MGQKISVKDFLKKSVEEMTLEEKILSGVYKPFF